MTINTNDKTNTQNNSMLRWGSLLAVIIPIGAGLYTLGRYDRTDVIDDLKAQIDSYEKLKKLNLQETVEKIAITSEKLQLNVHQQSELARISNALSKTEAIENELNKEIKSLKVNIDNLAIDKVALESKLSHYEVENKSFTIKIGTTAELIPNLVFMGLTSLYTSSAKFSIGSESFELNVGQSYEFAPDKRACTATLMNSNYGYSADVKMVCRPI